MMILIGTCSCRCERTPNFCRCDTVPICFAGQDDSTLLRHPCAAADGWAGRQFLLCQLLFLSKPGIALDDRRRSMSLLPLSVGSSKLYMCSNCPRRYGIIGHAITNRLASYIIIVGYPCQSRKVPSGPPSPSPPPATRTNPTIHHRLLPCQLTRQFPSSKSCRPRRRRRLVALSLPFVPIATIDSSTTSAFAEAQSVAPAGRLDKNTRAKRWTRTSWVSCGSRQRRRVPHRTNHLWDFVVRIEKNLLVAADFRTMKQTTTMIMKALDGRGEEVHA
jgi:hypothetical protein